MESAGSSYDKEHVIREKVEDTNICVFGDVDEWDDTDESDLVNILELSEAAEKCNSVDSTQRKDHGDCKQKEILQENEKETTYRHVIASVCSKAESASRPEPLKAFRPGYLWVSDFSTQHWCEQKLHYSFTMPTVVEENPAMTEGSNLHLARELAAHDKVDVKVTSNEDIWAIKVVNLLMSIQFFLNGQPLAREVPVFGAPFGQDVFVVGLIDELQFDLDNYSISLSDLKTRTSNRPPSKSQQKQHHLQVMLYKKLFDDLVQGNVSKALISKHLRLDLNKSFGDGIQMHLTVNGFDCRNLNQLLDFTFHRLQSCTCIHSLSIEYVFQETKQTIGRQHIDYDEQYLQTQFLGCLDYWMGRRPPQGVDIEEAWKCQRCDFVEVCEWRARKDREYSEKNKRNVQK